MASVPSIYSGDSISLLLSDTSEMDAEEEEEECPKMLFVTPRTDEIDHFTKINRDEYFDIHPSWSGMNIKTVTNNKVDMRILAKRVIYLLESAAYHTKLMGALPTLLQNNGARIRQWMTTRDADYVLDAVRRCHYTMREEESLTSGARTDGNLRQAYRLLAMNKCLPLYVKRHPPALTYYSQQFLEALEEFGVYARQQIELTAQDLITRNSNMRLIFEQIRDRHIELARLTKIVNANFAKYDSKTQKKAMQVTDMENQLNDVLNYYADLKQKCLMNSEKILYQSDETSVALQTELSEEAREARLNYTQTLENHLSEERALRTRKIKDEAQLSMWLAKFDGDVGEKQRILEEMTEEYERDNMEVQELECLMLEQAIVYTRFQNEQDEDKLKAIKDKLFVIASQRAAKILQKYWRRYKIRKANRKANKTKKLKKKKK